MLLLFSTHNNIRFETPPPPRVIPDRYVFAVDELRIYNFYLFFGATFREESPATVDRLPRVYRRGRRRQSCVACPSAIQNTEHPMRTFVAPSPHPSRRRPLSVLLAQWLNVIQNYRTGIYSIVRTTIAN